MVYENDAVSYGVSRGLVLLIEFAQKYPEGRRTCFFMGKVPCETSQVSNGTVCVSAMAMFNTNIFFQNHLQLASAILSSPWKKQASHRLRMDSGSQLKLSTYTNRSPSMFTYSKFDSHRFPGNDNENWPYPTQASCKGFWPIDEPVTLHPGSLVHVTLGFFLAPYGPKWWTPEANGWIHTEVTLWYLNIPMENYSFIDDLYIKLSDCPKLTIYYVKEGTSTFYFSTSLVGPLVIWFNPFPHFV